MLATLKPSSSLIAILFGEYTWREFRAWTKQQQMIWRQSFSFQRVVGLFRNETSINNGLYHAHEGS